MPPPTNQTAATAIDLGAFPANVTQNVHDAGTTYTVWYKFTASQTGLVGLWGHDQALLFVYDPVITIFLGPAGAPVQYLSGSLSSAFGIPCQFPVDSGTEYFVRCAKNAGNPSPAVLEINAEFLATTAVETGDILVNDDTADLPAIIIDKDNPGTNQNVKNYVPGFASGECGDILSNGRMLFGDIADGNTKLYDSDFTLLATVALNSGASFAIRADKVANVFYVKTDGASDIVSVVDQDGNITATHTLTGQQVFSGAGDTAAGIYYFSPPVQNSNIKRWDLVGGVLLSDLVAPGAVRWVQDILVLADGTIIASFLNTATGAEVRQYSAAGALLNSYGPYTFASPAGILPRLAYGLDDTTFWLWTHNAAPDAGTDTFREIRISDGVVVTSINTTQFEFGVYGDTDFTAPARYGVSRSCPFIVLRGLVADGSINVIKVTNPTPDVDNTTFTFVAGGGLAPGTFGLKDGESQLFDPVTPGSGYSIVEDANANYITTYVVSNGSPNTNITVGAGEAVTVTVTNTRKGEIIVPKMTDPYDEGANTFDFTADAPLSPTSFDLLSDEEQIFSGLTPGTYALRETQPEHFNPTYLFSNNSTSPEAISVAAGESVTVAVLNGLQSPGSGLYKLVPGKRDDTVINQDQQEVKRTISPFFITAFLQDK